MCHSAICKHCACVLSNDNSPLHVCNQDDVKSTQSIKAETKPCPGCATFIYKIDGCDQMWCTGCHTSFSWTTGLEDGDVVVHNPHYYEWQRQQNGGVAPRVRGDNPNRAVVFSYYDMFKGVPEGDRKDKLVYFYRITQHSPPRFPSPAPLDNRDLRVKYLLGDITKETLAKRVEQRDKKREKEVEINQIFETFFKGSLDVLKSKSVIEVDTLVKFVNQQLLVVSKKYRCKKMCIVYDRMDGYTVVV